jgi:hypothetical protein
MKNTLLPLRMLFLTGICWHHGEVPPHSFHFTLRELNKMIKVLCKYILNIIAWVFFTKTRPCVRNPYSILRVILFKYTKNLQQVLILDCRCVISDLNLKSLKLKLHSTAKTRWQLLFDKLATNMINCPYSNPVMSFIWPWYHHFWSFCWVMFLLLRELSITNMLGQVYIEMAKVSMSRPLRLFCETL